MKRVHYYQLWNWRLWHPESFEVTDHNNHYSIDFRNRTTVILKGRGLENLLLSFIAVGFQIKIK